MVEEFVTRSEYQHDREKLADEIQETNNRVTILETMFESFKSLPDSLQNLDKTMALMQVNLEGLNKSVDEVKRDIKRVDEKGKFDFIEFVKQNWWKIAMGIAAILVVVKEYLPSI